MKYVELNTPFKDNEYMNNISYNSKINNNKENLTTTKLKEDLKNNNNNIFDNRNYYFNNIKKSNNAYNQENNYIFQGSNYKCKIISIYLFNFIYKPNKYLFKV